MQLHIHSRYTAAVVGQLSFNTQPHVNLWHDNRSVWHAHGGSVVIPVRGRPIFGDVCASRPAHVVHGCDVTWDCTRLHACRRGLCVLHVHSVRRTLRMQYFRHMPACARSRCAVTGCACFAASAACQLFAARHAFDVHTNGMLSGWCVIIMACKQHTLSMLSKVQVLRVTCIAGCARAPLEPSQQPGLSSERGCVLSHLVV